MLKTLNFLTQKAVIFIDIYHVSMKKAFVSLFAIKSS